MTRAPIEKFRTIGRTAAELLFRRLNGSPARLVVLLIPPPTPASSVVRSPAVTHQAAVQCGRTLTNKCLYGQATCVATLRIEDKDDRLVVWLDQPMLRNAIDAVLVGELDEVCARLERAPKPLVITSAHGYFAAGADLRELADAGRDFALHGRTRRLFARISALPMPTVAAVDGYAIGGGAELTYACDIRLASTRAVFANPEPSMGITAAAGGCWRLPELVGPGMAKLMLFTGYRLGAEEALRCGLVARVVEPEDLLDAAHELVDRMGKASASALRVTKLVLDARLPHPTADALAQALLLEDDEKCARMAAFLDKT